MSTWRERKYGGQGNRAPRGTATPRNHAEDGHCHCKPLRSALGAGKITTITTVTGPDGKQYPITDEETARRVKNRAYTCGSIAGVSLVMSEPGLGIVDLGDGRWGFRFRPVNPASGKAHVDKLITSGQRDQLAYDYAKTGQRPRRKSMRATEAEQVAAHRPLADAIAGVVYHDRPPGPIPPIPAAPAGFDAVTGRRIRDPRHAVRVGDETIGTQGQILLELLRAKREQPQAAPKPRPAAPAADNTGKTVISDLIERWKTGQH